MDSFEILKLVLGVCLVTAGGLCFSLWRDRLKSLKDDEKAKFLMYNIMGGSWIIAVFFLCGGFYCVLEPLSKI